MATIAVDRDTLRVTFPRKEKLLGLVRDQEFRSRRFAATCRKFGLRHVFTRPYRPQTNGKAERFIQSALREWAYGIPYRHSAERTAMLNRWMHHYNWHRPHHGIGKVAPVSRLAQSRNNLLAHHS